VPCWFRSRSGLLVIPPKRLSGFRLNRASRMGPFWVMNQGTVSFAPLSVAKAIEGFIRGLVPPGAGCEWQARHWLELKRGPSPLLAPPVTTSTSANLFRPSLKNRCSSFVRPARGPPALQEGSRPGLLCRRLPPRTGEILW
jgi:hypothetical protein